MIEILKILLIGSGITSAHHMPVMFQELFNPEVVEIRMDTIFRPDCSLECALIQPFYPEDESCTPEFLQYHSVWQKGSRNYEDFTALMQEYDVIFLQSASLESPVLYEIIKSIDRIVDTHVKIIVFQNYSTITSSDNMRRNELNKQFLYFTKHNKSKRVILLNIGDRFDQLTNEGHTHLFDGSGLPTIEGSTLIAKSLYDIVRTLSRNK